MATPSQVDVLLDQISARIAQNRQRLTEAKASIAQRTANLAAIPAEFADLIATVNDVGYGGDTFQDYAKAKLAALTSEFQTLRTQAAAVDTWLTNNVTEF